MELPACGDPNHLVVHRIILVKQMLEDLVYDRLLLLGHLDSYPLRDDDGDATADNIVAWLLFRNLDD